MNSNPPEQPVKLPSADDTRLTQELLRGRRLAGIFLVLLAIMAFYFGFKIIQPYLNTIIIAILLSSVWAPVHVRVLKLLKGRETLASIISCILIVLVVILPLTAFATALVQQGIDSFNAVRDWIQAGGMEKAAHSEWAVKIINLLKSKFELTSFNTPDVTSTIMNFSSTMVQFLLSHAGTLLQNMSSLFMKFFLMIFLMFFLFREGGDMKNWLLHLSPLSRNHEEQLLNRIRSVSRSALWGSLATAVAQGTAGGTGLLIVGIPALFWGAMMGFASLIPVVGTAMVWVPACVYLLIIGSWGKAIFLGAWSIAVVGSIDNFLRPVLMKGEAGMSPLLLFFAILGGIGQFGLIGIIYGPLIFGLCAVLLYIYELEFAGFLKRQDET
ncbi:AI-2E family transporter [bacterium]|nr:AI-2E family transporter [candidate division CSSED10-310 bacterium]